VLEPVLLDLVCFVIVYRIDRSHVFIVGASTDGGSVVEWISYLLNRPMSSAGFQLSLYQAETRHESTPVFDSFERPQRQRPSPHPVAPPLMMSACASFAQANPFEVNALWF
jgi:hypothetical protein